MDDLELRASRSNVSKVVEDIYMCYITYEQIQPSTYEKQPVENSIRDARTPQPGKIVFNTMRYRSSETVLRLGYFQYQCPNNV